MKSGHSNWGLPDLGIAGAVAVQLAKRYGYISDVYGLSTASCSYDGQSGFEKMNNALLPYLSGANILSGSGALANLSVASFEQLAIDNEIIAVLRKIGRGVAVNSETLALEVIADVFGGGEFLAQDHTVKHLRGGEVFIPQLSYGGSWSEWAGGSKKDITAKARERVEKLLAAEPESSLPPEISREIDRVMRTAESTLLKSGHA
ncbi:MAG: trimethylamine methyltransferase family protein, partial [Dethiobacteria bacterium]|nr:trimethylamine methyltransferase family protein [Dethiobacteria bacterium]